MGKIEERCMMWQQRVEAQQASGLSITAWCQHEGIAEANFYYWRKRLSKLASAPLAELIAVPMSTTGSEIALEMCTPGGYIIRVSNAAQVALLPVILAAVR